MKLSNEARRLHPLTLVQRFIVSLPGLIFILLPVFRETDSTAWFNLVIAAIYAAFLLPWIAVYYLRFRYWITPTELIIHSGVVTRRKRNIPIDRIQNIEIEQGPLQRILRTAKVAVYTAGSANAEGVLEYVSIDEAREIREGIRRIQEDLKEDVESAGRQSQLGLEGSDWESESVGKGVGSPSEVLGAPIHGSLREKDSSSLGKTVFEMSPKRVAMSGAFHFSLLYIAGMFSILQYFDPDPTVFMDWLLRGPLESWNETIQASPWTAAFLAGLGAVFLGWATGVLVTINKWHHFKVTLRDNKLHRRHGLMTLAEGTIPLRKVQSYIVRTNPIIRRAGFFRLELQTLGIDVKDNGFQVAAPFARSQEVNDYLEEISPVQIPSDWKSVSPITIRRFGLRYSVVLGLLLLAFYGFFPALFPGAFWALLALPIIWTVSWFRYKNTGYAVEERGLVVKRGVFYQHMWLIPFQKAQTFSIQANYFQRRLGLATLYVDTAGASALNAAELIDLPEDVARRVLESTYDSFKST